MDREACRKGAVEPLRLAEHARPIFKKGEGNAAVDQAQGKVKVGPGHINPGKCRQGVRQDPAAVPGDCLDNLRLLPVGDMQIGQQVHPVEKAHGAELFVLGILFHNKIR